MPGGGEADAITSTGPITSLASTYVNLGDGYDATTGTFTAPRRGLYSFKFQALVRQAGADGTVGVTFYKNGVDVNAGSGGCLASTTVIGDADHDSMTASRTIRLEEGDKVQAYACEVGANTDIYLPTGLSYFSGKLLDD